MRNAYTPTAADWVEVRHLIAVARARVEANRTEFLQQEITRCYQWLHDNSHPYEVPKYVHDPEEQGEWMMRILKRINGRVFMDMAKAIHAEHDAALEAEEDDTPAPHWNYRIIDRSATNGGDPWFAPAEAWYEGGSGIASSHGEPINALGSETIEGVIDNVKRLLADIERCKEWPTIKEMQ